MSRPNAMSENPANLLTVQDAIYDTVHHSADPNGQRLQPKVIADVARIDLSRLYSVADPSRSETLYAEEVAALTLATGNTLILDTIERAVGRVAFSVPPCQRPGDVLALSAKAAKEFGKFLEEIAVDDADGVWTTAELARLKRQRDYLFAAVNAAISRAEQAERKPVRR